MLEDQRHVFWQALLIAIFIFALGILLGYFIELNRTSKIITAYQEAELNLLDVQIQEEILSLSDFDCQQAIAQTIDFADRTYNEALVLEKYTNSAKLSQGIVFQHKKYDLLRAILWMNSIKIRDSCQQDFHTVVYFYDYDTGELDTRDQDLEATQRTFSRYLGELKAKYGDDVLLIPIAGNLEINSINFLRTEYDINVLPTILVDEELKVINKEDLGKIDDYLG